MRRVPRSNRVRYHGGRPPPGDVPARWDSWVPSSNQEWRDRHETGQPGWPGVETEEVGLSLTPPSRYRSLLVPLDGSAFGEHALPLALSIARRADASVRLIHVDSSQEARDGLELQDSDSLRARLRERQQAYLDGVMRRLSRGTRVKVTPILTQGREVAASLCKVSAATDLVVMATHGRGLLGRWWRGSVADALLQQITAPLLLVKGYEAPVDLSSDPAPRHVVISLDGSPGAEQVLEPALALGELTGARHTLLRVMDLQPDYSIAYGQVGNQMPAQERKQTGAWNYLRNLARQLGGEAARIHPRLLISEQGTAASILWYARERDGDLIALTTRRRGPLSRLFRGRVVDQVVRRTTTPVLVVREVE